MTGGSVEPASALAARPVPPLADVRAIERSLREEVRREVDVLLGRRQAVAPDRADEERIRTLIAEHVAAHQRRAAGTNAPLLPDPASLERRLFDDLLRLGPLQPLMEDPAVEEIIINGPARVFVIREGRKELVQDLYFDDDADLLALVKRAIGPLGRRLDEASPLVDVRLRDGSRLNAAIPPATTDWTGVTIRKFLLRAHTLADLVELGTLTESAAAFLAAAVQAGVNILVSGATGSGKTTLLNALGASIASLDERVITIEETPELQLARRLPDCASLQARPGNVEGEGEITVRDLVRNALRMRPTRIIVGEVRGGEALDMLLALNTGHDGSLGTIHGNGPRDALARLATLARMTAEQLPREALIEMVGRTIELVVHLRVEPRTGRRRLVHIFEVTGLEGDVIAGQDLWTLDRDDRLAWTGLQPRCLAKFASRGVVYALPPAAGYRG
ncbi:MAG TPA: ATPase, T2SS/T4P/T4SS family [Thermomicrobiales bacterium]|nr:ATPase, T2SS/T4P/T4SS family [Thermomicrobiales bacterium]